MNFIIKIDIDNILNDDGLQNEWSQLHDKTVLITGAAGMIPSYIVYTLMTLGNVKVIVNVRKKEKAERKFYEYFHNSDFKLLVQDVDKPLQIDEHIDVIIHAASLTGPHDIKNNPVDIIRANIIGTENLLRFAQENSVQKFMFLSSATVYGKPINTEKCTENDSGFVDETASMSSYVISKRMGEYMCSAYNRQFKLNTSIARISQTYGPGYTLYNGGPSSDFIGDIVNKRNITIKSAGLAKRDFSYLSDIVTGLFYILLKDENASVYNISDMDSYMSIIDFANKVLEAAQDNALSIVIENKDDERVYNYGLDSSRLMKLGWKPKVTAIEGLKRTIEYFRVLPPPPPVATR